MICGSGRLCGDRRTNEAWVCSLIIRKFRLRDRIFDYIWVDFRLIRADFRLIWVAFEVRYLDPRRNNCYEFPE